MVAERGWCLFDVDRAVPRIFQGFYDEDISETRDPLHDILNTPDLIRYHGYRCEEHIVMTADGYYLVLHRILPRLYDAAGSEGDSEDMSRQRQRQFTSGSLQNILPSPEPSVANTANEQVSAGPPVLMLHGAMLSSETWVCQRVSRKNLALQLVDQGYDVWLGNRRGNKYSQKHVTLKPYEERFWDFSMDETILHDVPAQVEHVLGLSAHKTVSIVGFSQGTAEAFAALSISRKFAKRVNSVVALSATAKPRGLTNSLIKSMIHWTPELMFLMFGRKSMLKVFFFWQSVLSPRAMVWLLDLAMWILFNWRSKNIKARDKPLIYRHLFSQTSVKQIVHWFQIMRAARFQMFEDVGPGCGHIVPEYPLDNVRVPIAVFCGMKDTLVDFAYLSSNLRTADIRRIPGYEHMDTLWAHDADTKVYTHVLDFMRAQTPPVPRRLAAGSMASKGLWSFEGNAPQIAAFVS